MGWIVDLLSEVPLSAVLREKVSQLESKYTALEAENKILKSENGDLRLKLDDARREIERLKKQAEETLIAAHSALESEQIRASLGQHPETTKFHLDELRKAHLIEIIAGTGLETYWRLQHEGRRYLVQHGLLK